jgi:8-oxo-dGTP pyrophosphatase MutT (NUDIX family)
MPHNDQVFPIHVNGQDWLLSWHLPPNVPTGKPHGSAGICITDTQGIVLISPDGIQWDLPAGRPEGNETWEKTIRREMWEEACATVVTATLLGFCRGHCIAGREAGLVLVRSFWRAQVTLAEWKPQFEIAHRRVVQPEEVLLLLPQVYLPISRSAFAAAGLLPQG